MPCVGGRASRARRGVSLDLLSPAELRNVYQREAGGNGRLEPLSPAGTSLRLIDLKDYALTTVHK